MITSAVADAACGEQCTGYAASQPVIMVRHRQSLKLLCIFSRIQGNMPQSTSNVPSTERGVRQQQQQQQKTMNLNHTLSASQVRFVLHPLANSHLLQLQPVLHRDTLSPFPPPFPFPSLPPPK